MQTVLLRMALVLSLFLACLNLQAQVTIEKETYNSTIDSLRFARQKIEKEEKEELKKSIELLQDKLRKEEITLHEFEAEKVHLAEKHAKNIASRTLIIDEAIDYIKRNEGEGIERRFTLLIDGGRKYKEDKWLSEFSQDTSKQKVKTYYASSNSSGMFLAAGFSNTIGDNHSLDDTPYKMAGSRFFELGYNWRTALKKNSSVHIRYGIGLHIDGYKPSDNMYFVKENKELHLEEHPIKLKKSKLRATNLVVPFHFEFAKPKLRISKNGNKIYSYANTWHFGVGGYAGMNIKTIQKLKFKEGGERFKSKENMSDAINQTVYGLSAYVGKGQFSLYGRYALNDMFKGDLRNENTLAIGLRYTYF